MRTFILYENTNCTKVNGWRVTATNKPVKRESINLKLTRVVHQNSDLFISVIYFTIIEPEIDTAL